MTKRCNFITTLIFIVSCLYFPSSFAGTALDLSDAVGWWDANDIDGDGDENDNPAANSSISSWADKSGAGHPLVPVTSGVLPVFYSASDLSKNAVYMDGKSLTTGYSADYNFTSSGGSVFLAVRNPENSNYEVIFSTRVNEDGLIIYHQSDIFRAWARNSGTGGWNAANYSTAVSRSDRSILEYKIQSDGRSRELAFQGQRFAPGLTGTVYASGATAPFNVGSHYNGTWQAYNYFVNEVIVFNRFVNECESVLINNYLSEKWASTLSQEEYFEPYGTPSSIYVNDIGGVCNLSSGAGETRDTQGIGGLYLSSVTMANGSYAIAGHDQGAGGLNSTGVLQRNWYIDATSAPTVGLQFKASDLSLTVTDGDIYDLYYSSDGGSSFTNLNLDQAFSGGVINFSLTPSDGIYTLIAKPKIKVQKMAQVISDDVNGTAAAKAIPGSILEYTLRVSNHNSARPDTNTITLTDSLASNMKLVGHAYGANQTINFVDACASLPGSSSNLSLSSANIVYKNSGGNAVSAPNAGTVNTVSYLEFNPQGYFNEYLASSPPPCFEIKFRVELQ